MKHVKEMFYVLMTLVVISLCIGFLINCFHAANEDKFGDVVNGCVVRHYQDNRFWPPMSTKYEASITYCETERDVITGKARATQPREGSVPR